MFICFELCICLLSLNSAWHEVIIFCIFLNLFSLSLDTYLKLWVNDGDLFSTWMHWYPHHWAHGCNGGKKIYPHHWYLHHAHPGANVYLPQGHYPRCWQVPQEAWTWRPRPGSKKSKKIATKVIPRSCFWTMLAIVTVTGTEIWKCDFQFFIDTEICNCNSHWQSEQVATVWCTVLVIFPCIRWCGTTWSMKMFVNWFVGISLFIFLTRVPEFR